MTTDTAERTAKSGFCLTGSHMGCERHPLAAKWCRCTCHESPRTPLAEGTLPALSPAATEPTTTYPRDTAGRRKAKTA